MDHSDLPRFDQLMFPVIEALKEAGGSGLRNEIIEAVADRQRLSEEQLERRYETTGVPVLADRIGWALSWLKKLDAVENSRRGVWALTMVGASMDSAEVARRLKVVRSELAAKATRARREAQQGESGDGDSGPGDGLDDEGGDWKGKLLERLLELPPDAFERLTQRLLREAGFRDVEVLGKAGDGGIDGVGVYRLSLVSFPIYFQCKRYKGSVSAGTVRDFRGAMAGRGEKGLLVTTGNFTRSAREESSRDGAPPVELIDGDDLCGLLKEYDLGVQTRFRQVEDIELDLDFFTQFTST